LYIFWSVLFFMSFCFCSITGDRSQKDPAFVDDNCSYSRFFFDTSFPKTNSNFFENNDPQNNSKPSLTFVSWVKKNWDQCLFLMSFLLSLAIIVPKGYNIN
jgi:hypothetical protein